MLQDGFYDPYDDEELAKKMSDFERKKKQYANLYCRRQRMEDKTCKNMGTNVLLQRADRCFQENHRGGRAKGRKIKNSMVLEEYLTARDSGEVPCAD